MESREILPENERYSEFRVEEDLHPDGLSYKYHKALEAAEKKVFLLDGSVKRKRRTIEDLIEEITQLKESKSILRQRLKTLPKMMMKAFDKDKEERYEKAVKLANDEYLYGGEDFSLVSIEEALKIAAGIC